MSRRVSISMADARTFRDFVKGESVDAGPALARLERVMEPKRKAPNEPKLRWNGYRPQKPRKPSKEEKRESRASIREKVFLRASTTACAGPQCEGPYASNPLDRARCENVATDLSHLFGKGKGRLPESVRTCAAWCRSCHDTFGASDPSAVAWWTFIAWWLRQLGYSFEAKKAGARAFFVDTRASLPAAPRTGP